MLRGLKQTWCAPGPRDPPETETDRCVSVPGAGTDQQRTGTAAGAGAMEAADLGVA